MDLSRSSLFLRSAALGLLAVLVLSPVAAAAPSRVSLSGDLVGLSAAGRTVSVRTANGAQVILRVTNSTTLKRNGATTRITGLALRDRVSVQYEVASSALVSLKAQGPAIASTRGTVSALDTTGRVELATPNGPRSFLLGPATLIVRNGRAAAPQDLTLRDTLLVHSRSGAPSPATALDVVSDGPETDEVEGTISAISDPDVTITPEHGAARVVHVVATTVIELHDRGTERAGTIADLAVGQRAEAHYDPASNNALRLEVRVVGGTPALRVEGTVTAVDARASSLTLTPRTGNPVDLTTDANTRISLNEAAATLADIPVGARAQARYDGTTHVASQIEVEVEDDDEEGEVEGRVTAASAAAITITPAQGAAVDLTADGSTRIRLNGRIVALAEIPVGARAEAHYDRTTFVASRIEAVATPPSPGGNREIEGRVTAVSATSLTLTPRHGAAVVLVLDAATVIVRDGHPATAADLRVGDEAEARYDATTLLAKSVRAHHEDDDD